MQREQHEQQVSVIESVLDPAHELHLLLLTVLSFVVLACTFLFLIPTVISVSAQQSHSMVGCHDIVFYKEMQGYAPPVELFADTQPSTLSVRCGEGVAGVTAGNGPYLQYVYKYGYIREAGEWRRFQFTGAGVTDEWLQGPVYATFARSGSQLSQANHVVAFMCTWHDSRWKCGCGDHECRESFWTLQSFSYAGERVLEGPDFPFPVKIPDIAVFYPNRYVGSHGTRLTLTGYGFTQTNNTVIFKSLSGEEYAVPNVSSRTTESLSFVVPDTVPYGVHSVGVRNARGTSFNTAMFVVQRPGATPPRIVAVSPSSGARGTRITLHGDNFTPTGNMVYTAFGIVRDLPSPDGMTITFDFEPYAELDPQARASMPNVEEQVDVKLQVANENGLTAAPTSFYWIP